jgi:hypothetical protein
MRRPERATSHGLFDFRWTIYEAREKSFSAAIVNEKCNRRRQEADRIVESRTGYEKLKRGSRRQLVAVRQDQQRTNTSCQLALPTHGFTVVLSVFGGTPLLQAFKL